MILLKKHHSAYILFSEVSSLHCTTYVYILQLSFFGKLAVGKWKVFTKLLTNNMWHKGDNNIFKYGTWLELTIIKAAKKGKMCLFWNTSLLCFSLSVIILGPRGAIYCRTLDPDGQGLPNLICSSVLPVSRCSVCPKALHCEEAWTWWKGWRLPGTSGLPTPPSSSAAIQGCKTQSYDWPQRWSSPSGSTAHGRPAGLSSEAAQQRGRTKRILPPGCELLRPSKLSTR